MSAGIYELNVGHYDFYRTQSEVVSGVSTYIKGVGGNYTYNDDGTFTFTPGVGDHNKNIPIDLPLQSVDQETDAPDAYIETVNYSFINDLNSATISLFLDTALSIGKAKIQYASDTNYVINSQYADVKLGETAETNTFANANVRYGGSKQVKKSAMSVLPRNNYSNKIKISAPLEANKVDDFILHTIKLVGDNLFYEGGDHGQNRT